MNESWKDSARPVRALLERGLHRGEGGGGHDGGAGRFLARAGLAVLVLLVVFSSYYQVAPYERGVLLRFGRYAGTVGAGPHFKLPLGIDRVIKVETEKQHKLEFGFRTEQAGQKSTYLKGGPELDAESLMLTGDLNIADVEWVVQYRIVDPYRYLFALSDIDDTLRAVAEAEMRGAVGDMGFDEVIKTQRPAIEELVRRRMNEILKAYGAGVEIRLVQLQDVHPPDPVKDSFEEVNRALQEMERSINEALRDRNQVLFRVEGEAKQRISQAEGAGVARVNQAQGDARRFDLLLAEYRKAPGVTRDRLYLEAMGKVLPKAERIVIVDEGMKGMLPVLDLGRRNGAVPDAPPAQEPKP